jgi:hypothetical protein
LARLLRHLDEELHVQDGRLCLYGTDHPEIRDAEPHEAARVLCSEVSSSL